MSWFDKLFGEETPSDRTSSEKNALLYQKNRDMI